MNNYVALLRGINVGGRTRIAMGELRDLFIELGFSHVNTYIQSGNVVFRTARAKRGLAAELAARIAADLGVPAAVLLRTDKDLARILAANPFANRVSDISKLHVTFLDKAPASSKGRVLEPPEGEPAELALIGSEVFLHTPNGYGRTKANNAFIESRLGVAATTRNWRTVNKLVELTGERSADPQ